MEEVKNMEASSKQLKFELAKLCWFMRGGMTLDEAYATGPEDREIISTLIKENLDTTKETKLPFF